MATDLTTANVVDTKVGTGWTINVTACNLLSDLSIKDFIVLIAGSLSANSNFTKTSQTVLTYNGTSIASSTVEVRRVTPQNRFQEITFAEKLSSTVFNEEIDRLIRKAYEYTLNGIGPGSVSTVQTPLDDVYSATWNGDTVRPATRNAIYDKIELLGDLADDEAITGNWTAPTQADANNSTRLATTAFAHTRVTNALSNSPSLGGNPTAATQATSNDSTRLATTAYVRNILEELIYPVGSLYFSATVSTNPNSILGFGTWVVFAAGQVLVGLNLGDTDFDTAEETGGSKTHTLTVGEIPEHSHTVSFTTAVGAIAAGAVVGTNTGGTSGLTGGGGAHNNLQPYIVVYIFKRTA